MNKQLSNPALNGVTRNTAAYLLEKCWRNALQQDSHWSKTSQIQHGTKELVISRKKKISVKVDSLAQGILEHVRLAPKLTETLKGKLSLGARILQLGGVEKVFKKLFNVKSEGVEQQEKLVKASQCYLSTTQGPIAGLLFISTHRVAFCSERSIKMVSPTGKRLRIYYKVSIPMKKIVRASTSQDMKRPSQKYIEVVTEDNFEFWFMGFLNHRKTLQCVEQMVMNCQAS